MTLVGFLRARLAEDEQIARAATGPSWHLGYIVDGPPGRRTGIKVWTVTLPNADPFDSIHAGETVAETPQQFDANHIARWDPARVLAEVAAKRRIVDEHGSGADPCDAHDASLRTITCDTLRVLAEPYADHPKYRPEWRP